MIINEILQTFNHGMVVKTVWIEGRAFNFITDNIIGYEWASVSAEGILSLHEVKPEILEFEKRWSDGFPYKTMMLAKVELDDLGGDWKESLTKIVVENGGAENPEPVDVLGSMG